MRPLGDSAEYPQLLHVQAPATWETRCQFCLVTSTHVSNDTANYQMLHSYEELRMESQEIKEIRLRSVGPPGNEK